MNDDFFDLDSNQNSVREKNRLLDTQTSNDTSGKLKSVVEKKPTSEDNEDDDTDQEPTSCFQINYNERNQPVSVELYFSNPDGKSKSKSRSLKSCVYDLKTVALYQKLIAEYLGVFLLTLYACSIGLPIAEDRVPSINGCLGGGLTLATLIWAVGSVSGGHLNPAVTAAFLFTGKINPLLAVLYMGSQVLGGLSGASLLKNIAPDHGGSLSVTQVHPDVTLAQAFGVEAIITFVLVMTIFSCVDSKRKDLGGSFPLQIGIAVVCGGLFGGHFTGGSMNPARSFGPAAITGNWKDHWVYWVGPMTGGILAGMIYTFILRLKCPRRKPYHPIPRV
jgi:MIP family channel proteins